MLGGCSCFHQVTPQDSQTAMPSGKDSPSFDGGTKKIHYKGWNRFQDKQGNKSIYLVHGVEMGGATVVQSVGVVLVGPNGGHGGMAALCYHAPMRSLRSTTHCTTTSSLERRGVVPSVAAAEPSIRDPKPGEALKHVANEEEEEENG
ncbi:hypothetical protein Acr_20g0000260 [Actinidia rufa]|uniref:Uncharacterized protein n=1 Tax=Actinidia rufa TaxID=165716 RepID=A0A7J0GBZ6_9ERIC|nr:hypothetical protein Acr_20g0000260 [Actinidia rufa]